MAHPTGKRLTHLPVANPGLTGEITYPLAWELPRVPQEEAGERHAGEGRLDFSSGPVDSMT